jgi:hypothetical protein
VARIYDEVRGRPLYVVASRSNFEQPANGNTAVADAPKSEANTSPVVPAPEPEAREEVT